MALKDKKIGDILYLDGYTSMAQQNSREVTITGIKTKFDEDSGEPFSIIQVDDGDWYDSRDGSCWNEKNSMYYIEEIK